MFSTSVIRRCLGLAALVVLIQAAPAFATSDVVISQFRTQGVTNGDFVDLVNRSDHTVHLAQGGWRVSFLTADDSAPNPVNWNYGSVCSVARSIDDSHLIPAVTLAPGQHYLITQAGWTGTGGAASDMTFVACGNLPDTAAILTFDGGYDASTNNPIGSDSVGYGRVPLGNFSGEGNNLAIPPNDGSVYQRKTANGLAGSQDTDNSVNDWVTAAASPANYPSTVPKPDGSTDAPTAIIDTTATLHATVNPHGLPVTDCHYDIGLTTSYGTTVPCSSTPSGLSNVAVTGAATGLQSSKTYFYRIVATTSRGTLTGSPQSFTTLAANPGPTGTTDPATNNFAKSAIVKGTINVHGKTVSDCHFDYGKGSFTATAPCAPAPSGADAMPVSAQLTDLDPSSTYQFRLVVTTNGTPATLTGTTRTFTTTALTTTTHQLVISQFRTQGVTGGDYVDLMNITNGTLHVPTGWSLWNTNATGQNQCGVVSNGPAIVLAPGQHYLVTQSNWVGTPAADRTSGCSLFDDGGYLSLNMGVDPVTNSFLYSDTVYYGSYAYGSPYNPLPTNGNSLQRRNSGKQDTDISVDDFVPVSTIPQDAPGTAPAPTGSIAAPTSTTQTAATMNGSVDPKMGAVSVCKFQWGDTASYGNETNCATTPSGADNKPVSASLTGLTASHDYHYRLVVTTTGGTLTTDDQSLRTSDPLPVPTAGAGTSNGTGSATKVRAATVTLGGSVNPHNAAVTQCYFDLGTGGSYTTTVPCSPASPTGLNDVAVSGAATDLSPSTTYQFRLHVIGAYGDLVGDQQQFTTTAVVPTSDPVVISQFRTQGPGGDFVDLVNKSTALFTIPAGWSMTDGDGNSVCSVVTNGPEITLAPGQHYLIAENGYTGSPARDLAINGSCGSLRDTNAIVSFGATGTGDQVAYGAPGGFASIGEPDPIATVPSNGNALQRRGGGTRDTGSNSDDFVSVAASPRNYASDAPPATLSTDTPTSIASVKATLQGTINPAGETISGCQFQYATDAEHTTSTTYPHTAACNPATQSGFGAVPVSSALTGLPANTTYHYRLIATASKTGALIGTDRTFTTSDVPSVISIDDATLLGSRTATVNATINAQGDSISGCTFDYGDDSNYGTSKACSVNPSGTSPVQVSAALTGLTPSHEYHFRVRFTAAAAGAKQSGDHTFSTTVPPSASTGQPGSVATTSATLTGSVNPRGETVSDCHFDYGPTDSYGQSVTCPKAAAGTLTDTPVTAALTGLESTKGYHYRLVVTTNGSGTITGGDQAFTTTTPPSVSTGAPSVLRPTSLKLTGHSNPRDEAVNQCIFEWGEDDNYGHSVACANPPSGNTDTPVEATISGLTANHSYHYRLVVTTATSLTKYGDDMTATTAPPPSATTIDPTGLAATKANLHGTAYPHGENVTSCEFEYGTDSSSYGTTVPCSSLPASDGDSASAAVTDLEPGTTYHARLNVGSNPSGVAHGNDFEFTTKPAPAAATIAPTGLTATKAGLRGTAYPYGENVTGCEFEYGTDSSSYGTTVPCSSLPAVDGDSASAALSGLSPDTTYHARLNLTTATRGVAHGNDFEFKTEPAPSVTTAPAGDLTQTTATLAGTAKPSGESVSDCHFEYGTDTNYGSSAPCDSTPSGTDPVAVTAALTGLEPGSTYHFRVVMTTPLGTEHGNDATFTTPAPAPTPSNPDTPSGPSTPSGPTTPSGPPDTTTPPPADTPLTAGQFSTLLTVPTTQTVPAAGTVTVGTVTCPKICGDVTITAFGPAGAARVGAAKTKKPPVYGTGKATVKKGKKVTLTFKLNTAGKKALKKSKKLKVSVTVALKQAGVSPVTMTKSIVLKPAKRKK